MKILLITTLSLLICTFTYSQEDIRFEPNQNLESINNEDPLLNTTPTTEIKKTISEEELTGDLKFGEIEENPKLPTTDMINEVSESTQPNDISQDHEREIVELTNNLAESDTQIQNLLDQINDLTKDNSELNANLVSASKELQNLLNETDRLNDELTHLEKLIEHGPGSIFKGWVYTTELNWVYVSPRITPYAFSQKDGWMKYEYGTDPRRVFYFDTDTWKFLDNPTNSDDTK